MRAGCNMGGKRGTDCSALKIAPCKIILRAMQLPFERREVG